MNRRIWLIFIIFLTLRLILAFQLPIFNDESIYMRWGLGFLERPDRWWAFMLDGKQPAVAISFGIAQFLPLDPLISMRLVSIVFSCITFWVVYYMASPYALVLLAFCPFLILFDTLALAESAVTASFAVSLMLTLSLCAKPKIWKGIAIGVTIALGWWFKSTALLAIPLVILTCILHYKIWRKITLGLFLGALIGFLLVTPIVFNLPESLIARTLTMKEILAFPWARWLINWSAIVQWFIGFGGPFLMLGWVLAWREKRARIFLLWALFPILFEAFILTSISARLLVISVIPVILLVVTNKKLKYLVLGSTMLLGLLMSVNPLLFYKILNPLPAAQNDFGQYVVGWPSGYGVKEAVEMLYSEAKKHQIVVFIRMDSGNPEDAIIAYLQRAHVPVFYIQQINDIAKMKELALLDWYFVTRGPQYEGMKKYLTEIAIFKKPLDEEFVGVYRIEK